MWDIDIFFLLNISAWPIST